MGNLSSNSAQASLPQAQAYHFDPDHYYHSPPVYHYPPNVPPSGPPPPPTHTPQYQHHSSGWPYVPPGVHPSTSFPHPPQHSHPYAPRPSTLAEVPVINEASATPSPLGNPSGSGKAKRKRVTKLKVDGPDEPSSKRPRKTADPPSANAGPAPEVPDAITPPVPNNGEPSTDGDATGGARGILSGPSVVRGGQRRPIPHPAARRQAKATKNATLDVWMNVRGIPGSFKNTSDIKLDNIDRPDPATEKDFKGKPTREEFTHVGCKLCPWDEQKLFPNTDGISTYIRNHLGENHWDTWTSTCKAKGIAIRGEKWKERAEAEASSQSNEKEPSRPTAEAINVPIHVSYTMEAFLERLIRWVVADDQAIRVVDNPYFRELLQYSSFGELEDDDIPHRTKMKDLIFDAYHYEKVEMAKEMQDITGQIHYTSDVWSNKQMTSFMAVTAHYFVQLENGRVSQRSRLCAFQHLVGSHTGVNLGQEFVNILDDLGVLHKIGYITLDNASNCDTMMAEVEAELRRRRIPFSAEENRLRCFPHVINLAVQDILDNITKVLSPEAAEVFHGDDIGKLRELLKTESFAVEDDVVHAVRGLIATLRVSGQRRELLQNIINCGNSDGWNQKGDIPLIWKQWWIAMHPEERNFASPVFLPPVQLLRDCPTRWSSTYLMITCFLELYPAIHRLVEGHPALLSKFKMTDDSLDKLIDIHLILAHPHGAQQLLSFESTPTLSLVLPVYERLITNFEQLQLNLPRYWVALERGIEKIQAYVAKARKSNVYIFAMLLNPRTKVAWMKQHWPPADVSDAECIIRDRLLKYCTAERKAKEAERAAMNARNAFAVDSPTRPRRAAASLSRGATRFLNMPVSRSTSVVTEVGSSATSTSRTSTPHLDTDPTASLTAEELEANAIAQDKLKVETELTNYLAEPLASWDEDLESSDLVRFWERRAARFPLLFKLALDVLAIQASSVSCERIFSSSKRTTTDDRNRIGKPLMEALQVLKHFYRSDMLNFVSDFVAEPIDMDAVVGSLNESETEVPADEMDYEQDT